MNITTTVSIAAKWAYDYWNAHTKIFVCVQRFTKRIEMFLLDSMAYIYHIQILFEP